MPDPLYVFTGAKVYFRAIKKPEEASWPDGKPVWTGANGSGDQANKTFTIVGTNLVIAECGNAVTGKVFVSGVDLDCDGNHDGVVTDADDSVEEIPGAYICVTNLISKNRVPLVLQKVEPEWDGEVELKINGGTEKIKVFTAPRGERK